MLTLLRRRAMGAAAGAAALAIACSWVGLGPEPASQPSPPQAQRDSVESVAPEPLPVPLTLDLQTEYQNPPAPDPTAENWAEAVLDRLTLRQKVAQMIMPWVLGDYVPEGVQAAERVRDLIEQYEVGGIIMSVGTPTEVAVKLNALQRRSRLPLLVGADLESGAGFRLFGAVFVPNGIVLGGATMFPTQMALGATREPGLAYEQGRITALEARAVGIHLTFAPVLDVNNNPDNPIINVRSYGEDPELVARLGAAYVRGAQDYGLVATGKHFPGHGDTGVDSHLDLPVINVDRRRLDAVELAPFRELIDAGLGAIMSAHIAVPALTRGEVVPSTLSRRILTDLLRDDLDFGGLIVTDAMDMYAVDRRYDRREAAVLAVEAGTDVLLMPPDVELAIQGLVGAVASGRLSEERIDQSVLRILRVKQRLGLHLRRDVDIEAIPRVVGIPEHVEVAQQAADRSVTLLRDEKGTVPLSLPAGASILSVTYRGAANLLAGRFFHAELRSRYTAVREVYVGPETPAEVYDRILADSRMADLVIVSPYVVAVALGGSVAVPPEFSRFITALAEAGTRHVVVSFGNPYLISAFPEVSSYVLAWSPSEVSQRAAARVLLGRLPISGRTPTRIPPFFEIGDGIQRPSRAEPQR
ncbi:MAG: glycoside hydrolase family 3 C-terminal domain-containing protein [Gemmatimonadetes bacterium]|nr:glycoside hydrolase family 3 C-terminal domain-containing protein [Gemmatimonadota bacterium]